MRSHYRPNPAQSLKDTPFVIKLIVGLIVGLSLFGALFSPLRIPQLLALSLAGLKQGFVWQLITSYFLNFAYGLSFGFLLRLGFDAYIIWALGSAIARRLGNKQFVCLIFFNGLATTALACLLLPLENNYYYSGCLNIVAATLFGWLILNNNSKLLLFFTMEIKAKWLIFGFIALTLFNALSAGDFIVLLTLLLSLLLTYALAILVWHVEGPFAQFNHFEKKLIYKLKHHQTHRYFENAKIFDFKTNKPKPNDAEFMDAMLDKISKEGQKALTRSEKRRMKKIAKTNQSPHN